MIDLYRDTRTRRLTFTVGWSDEDELWVAYCVEKPSLTTHGETPEQALYEIGVVAYDQGEANEC